MLMGGQLIRYIFARYQDSPLIYKYSKYHTQVRTTTKYHHNCAQPTFLNFNNDFIILTGTTCE